MKAAFIAAIRGVATNKLRSLLTMLGVIFGVAAVIVAVALGQGSRDAALRRFQRLGTTTLTVLPGRQSRNGVSFAFGSVSTLKIDDVPFILRGCPDVVAVSPEQQKFEQVKYGDQNTNTTVFGCGPDFMQIRHFDLAAGRFFTRSEDTSRRPVCVLGWTVYTTLFLNNAPAVGRNIYINGQNFKVIGVFAERGGGGFINEDDRVYVPIRTGLQRLFGGANQLSSMSVEGRSEEVMQRAQDEITEVLRKHHNIPDSKPNDFIIFNAGVAAQNSRDQAEDFQQLISYLAAVALIVGGIGIMNIMLVSVTERTREIGVRKAIGAKRRNILLQFLLEAVFISLTGGIIGVVLGVLFTLYALPYLKPQWETALTVPPLFVAFGFSFLVGIFFGFYPAMKASKLNPIDALRYE
jgi:putative ABC transport system permease protein